LTRFVDLHPGGANVLLANGVGKLQLLRLSTTTHLASPFPAGKDATDAFFGLHRHEVLLRPQYKRLQIGRIQGEEEIIKPREPGALSKVPYAEATWLADGYHSPYYSDNHRQFQKAVRKFFEEVIQPEALRCEENGKRISQEVVDKMRCVFWFSVSTYSSRMSVGSAISML